MSNSDKNNKLALKKKDSGASTDATEIKEKKFKDEFVNGRLRSLTVNTILGADAQKILRGKFAFLKEKLYLNQREEHHHPYGAFARAHFNRKVVNALAPKGTILDIGGHMPRTGSGKDSEGKLWTDRVHSMCPILGPRDRLRHAQWKAQLEMRGEKFPIANSCDCRMGGVLCAECLKPYSTVLSVDSWYFPDVMKGIYDQCKNGAIGYVIGNDYHGSIRQGKKEGSNVDGEGKFTILGDRVVSKVRGNPEAYLHGIPLSSEGSWQYQFSNKTEDGVDDFLVFENIDTLPNGDVDYCLFKVTYLKLEDGEAPLAISTFKKGELFFKSDNKLQSIATVLDPMSKAHDEREYRKVQEANSRRTEEAYKELREAREIARKLKETLSDSWRTQLEKVEVSEDGKVVLTTYRRLWSGETVADKVYRAPASKIRPEIAKLMGKTSALEVLRISRSAMAEAIKDGQPLEQVQEIADAVVIAMHYAGVAAGSILSHLNASEVVSKMKSAMEGKIHEFKNHFNWLSFFFLMVSLIFLGVGLTLTTGSFTASFSLLLLISLVVNITVAVIYAVKSNRGRILNRN